MDGWMEGMKNQVQGESVWIRETKKWLKAWVERGGDSGGLKRNGSDQLKPNKDEIMERRGKE